MKGFFGKYLPNLVADTVKAQETIQGIAFNCVSATTSEQALCQKLQQSTIAWADLFLKQKHTITRGGTEKLNCISQR